MFKNRKGFTLIELLVVIAIIGLLSTLAVVALGSAREKSRDARRVSDLKQIQVALELYYTDLNGYPTTTGSGITLGVANTTDCLNSNGFTSRASNCSNPYMGLVPTDPVAGQVYTYTSTSSVEYTITAVLEGTVSGLTGTTTANQSGITAG